MSIQDKFLKGFKSTFVLSFLALISQYLITVVLAKQGPEVLGSYTLLLTLTATITTFLVFGGNVFAPFFNGKTISEKYSLVLTYSLYVLVFSIIVFITFNSLVGLPQSISVLLDNSYISILIFIISVVIWNIGINFLNSNMAISSAALVLRAPVVILAVVFSILFVINTDIDGFVIYDVYLMTYMLLIAFLLIVFLRNLVGLENRLSFSYSFPKGFFSYAIWVQLSTISVFLFDHTDKFLFSLFTDNPLFYIGVYASCFQLNLVVSSFTRQVAFAIFPAFSHMDIYSQEAKKLYLFVCKWTVGIVYLVSQFIIIFSEQFMAIYGEAFVSYSNILSSLVLGSLFLSIGSINSSLIFASKKVKLFTLSNYTAVVIYIFTAYICLVFFELGVFGVAVAYLLYCFIVQAFNLMLTRRLGYTIPYHYLLAIALGLIGYFLSQNISSILSLFLLYFTISVIFILFGRYRFKEIKNILKGNI